MQHVVLTKGLPASGKSTWAQAEVRAKGWKRINRDLLRAMMDGGQWSPENEKFVVATRDALLTSMLRKGHSVIIDDTNFEDRYNWKSISELLERLDIDVTLREQCFPVELDEAIERDSKRLGTAKVGPEVITKMWKKHLKGNPTALNSPRSEVFYKKREQVLVQNPDLPKAVICDLDGTLALIGDRSPFDASRCDELDIPNTPVVEAVKAFHRMGYKIIFLSGRDEKDRRPTERFIIRAVPEVAGRFMHDEIERLKAQYVETPTEDLDAEARLLCDELVKIPLEVPESMLLMRKRGDMRKDTIVKREIWDASLAGKYNVLCAIDDRPSVCRMWRYDVGLLVMQVHDKEF
jgi:predicted kinase